MINMTKNRIPKVIQSGYIQSGDDVQSVQTDSTSEKIKFKISEEVISRSVISKLRKENAMGKFSSNINLFYFWTHHYTALNLFCKSVMNDSMNIKRQKNRAKNFLVLFVDYISRS